MEQEEVKVDRVVDARGSVCPGPLMALIGAVREQKVGDVIAVYSGDSGSRTDIPLWVEKAGHQMVAIRDHDGYAEFIVRKKR
jgi:TusA-related sulfurtransferase